MFNVIGSSWALLLGMFMLMVGNGLQGTLLGIRGGIEGFSTLEMSIVMSAYFAGFLSGSRLAPGMIRRVGHVRVFAALASLVSAVLILYPALPHPAAWTVGRIIVGFCFSGVYVTAESWLNNSSSNADRGKTLSVYMVVQMGGVLLAQFLLNVADISGYVLFITASVLVSLSFAPILLSISPTPAFAATKPMTLRKLIGVSPLGCVGIFTLGGVFAAQFAMASVYGTLIGLSVAQISIFVSSFYIGALLMQFPIGWASDRMDRRLLILFLALFGGAASVLAFAFSGPFWILLTAAFAIGGASNPLYALLIAYTNDFLDHDDMAAASGGLLFLNGLGAVAGPLIIGWLMGRLGPQGFFAFLALLLLGLAAYAFYRTMRRPSTASVENNVTYVRVMPSSSPVVLALAQEAYIEAEIGDGAQRDAQRTARQGSARDVEAAE